MIQNLHSHTTFCDGRNIFLIRVISQVRSGSTYLGFSHRQYRGPVFLLDRRPVKRPRKPF